MLQLFLSLLFLHLCLQVSSQQIMPILPLHTQRTIDLEDNFRAPQPIGTARKVYRSAQASAICNGEATCGTASASSVTCSRGESTPLIREWGMSIPQHWSYQKQESWDTFYDQRGWPNECYHETKEDTYPGESPIDVPPAETEVVPDGEHIDFNPGFNQSRSLLGISNNGHSVTVTVCSNYVDCQATASFGTWPKKLRHVPSTVADEYFLAQFHFHWGSDNSKGSEHLFCGRPRSAEMHMVFMNGRKVPGERSNPDSGTFLAVYGTMIEGGAAEDNAAFKPMLDYLSNAQQQYGKGLLPEPLVIGELLPKDFATKYYTYAGSLTTPPCSQRVTWFLAENFIRLSDRQLDLLRNLKVQTTWRGHGGSSSKALFFPFVALAVGTATQHALSRYAPFIPYTVAIMVEGALIDWLANQSSRCAINANATVGFCSQQITPGQCGIRPPAGCSIQDSLDMWANIDGHLLLMVFLPVLLFGDAMGLDAHVFKKTFWQSFLLACPGVVFGTFMMGLVAYHILPYDWSWNLSMAFGAIVSATDPVAVVALLKAVGATETLTMQIIGESLINDGTAMVMFSLFFSMHMDWGLCDPFDPLNCKDVSPARVVGYFMRMSVAGPILGIVLGCLAYFWMNRTSRSHNHTDVTIQISITVFTAYLAFYIAEQELFMSGVLCVVAASLFLARYAWPIVCSREAVQHVWHALEYFGNTLLFILSGVLTRRAVLNTYISASDIGWCLLMFLAMLLIRGVLVLVCYPVLSRIGGGLSPKDASFLVWGGLRGAVGLSLAAFSRLSLLGVDNTAGAQVMFLVAGLAFLTLVVNGVSSAPLLRLGKMAGISETKQVLLQKVYERVCAEVCDSYETICLSLKFDAVEAIDLVPALGRIRGTDHAEPNKTAVSSFGSRIENDSLHSGFSCECMLERLNVVTGVPDEVLLRTMRETFMRIVRMEYWNLMKKGSLPRNSSAALRLLESVSQALDNNSIPLHDWKLLEPVVAIRRKPPSTSETVSKSPSTVSSSSSIPKSPTLSVSSASTIGEMQLADAFLRFANRIFPSSVTWHKKIHNYFKIRAQEEAYYATSSFISAHHHAQETLAKSFSDSLNPQSAEEITVILESISQVDLAKEHLNTLSKSLVHLIKTKIVVSCVVESMHNCIQNLINEGVLLDGEAETILHRIDNEGHEIQKEFSKRAELSWNRQWTPAEEDAIIPVSSARLTRSISGDSSSPANRRNSSKGSKLGDIPEDPGTHYPGHPHAVGA